jgi:hypothetical protein
VVRTEDEGGRARKKRLWSTTWTTPRCFFPINPGPILAVIFGRNSCGAELGSKPMISAQRQDPLPKTVRRTGRPPRTEDICYTWDMTSRLLDFIWQRQSPDGPVLCTGSGGCLGLLPSMAAGLDFETVEEHQDDQDGIRCPWAVPFVGLRWSG